MGSGELNGPHGQKGARACVLATHCSNSATSQLFIYAHAPFVEIPVTQKVRSQAD